MKSERVLTREAELSECELNAALRSPVLGTAGGPVSQTLWLNELFASLLFRAICLIFLAFRG